MMDDMYIDGNKMRETEHKLVPKRNLKDILDHAQYNMFNNWLEMEGMDKNSVRYEDDLLNGIRIFATDPRTDEQWEIDFTNRELGGEE